MFWKRKEVDPIKERERRKERRDSKNRKKLKWHILRSFLQILYYKRKYRRIYAEETPEWKELRKVLDTPQKAFAYFSVFARVNNEEHQIKGVSSPKVILKNGSASDKSMAYLYSELLARHGYRTYVMWAGYRNGLIYPFCAVIGKTYTTTLGVTYKMHYGDQFQIMRDYFPDANNWKVMDRDGKKVIMSYIEGRSEYGSSDILIYDTKYWLKNEPLAYSLLSKMKLTATGNVDITGGSSS